MVFYIKEFKSELKQKLRNTGGWGGSDTRQTSSHRAQGFLERAKKPKIL